MRSWARSQEIVCGRFPFFLCRRPAECAFRVRHQAKMIGVAVESVPETGRIWRNCDLIEFLGVKLGDDKHDSSKHGWLAPCCPNPDADSNPSPWKVFFSRGKKNNPSSKNHIHMARTWYQELANPHLAPKATQSGTHNMCISRWYSLPWSILNISLHKKPCLEKKSDVLMPSCPHNISMSMARDLSGSPPATRGITCCLRYALPLMPTVSNSHFQSPALPWARIILLLSPINPQLCLAHFTYEKAL